MSTKQLLETFERVSEASGAVSKIRSFVLDLAVSGRLVPQDSQEEPAKQLAERILAASGGGARGQSRSTTGSAVNTPIHSLPFTVPDSWIWAYLTDICEVSYGFAFDSSCFRAPGVGMPLIRIRDISSLDTEAYFEGSFDARYLVHAGDYLVGMDGDFKVREWSGPDALLNQRVMRMRHWKADLRARWISIPLQMILDHIHTSTSQTTVKHLSAKQVNTVQIPLPPLAEQDRIVAKVDELMELCDQLEATQNDRESQRSALLSAALHRLTISVNDGGNDSDIEFFLNSSPRLMTKPEHLDGVRQSILDLAVQGRLVRQVPEDAPASDFLQDSQNASGYLADFSDETPLPPGWGKATIAQLSSMVTSGSRGWAEFYSETGSTFIRAQNIRFGQLRLDDLAHVTLPERHEGNRTKADRGDILIVITGAGVTNPALLEIDMADAYVSQHVGLVKLRSKEIAPWILLCLMARKGCRDDLVSRAYGAGKPGLNLDNIRTLEAPVPPLAEQRRVVVKVRELMTLCDELEAALDSANHERVRLLDALLHNALSERDGLAPTAMALVGS